MAGGSLKTEAPCPVSYTHLFCVCKRARCYWLRFAYLSKIGLQYRIDSTLSRTHRSFKTSAIPSSYSAVWFFGYYLLFWKLVDNNNTIYNFNMQFQRFFLYGRLCLCHKPTTNHIAQSHTVKPTPTYTPFVSAQLLLFHYRVQLTRTKHFN